jgi:hypothetical protein
MIVCEGYAVPRDKYLTKTETLGFLTKKIIKFDIFFSNVLIKRNKRDNVSDIGRF